MKLQNVDQICPHLYY